MATMGKIETHETVMRAHQSLVDLQVGRAATEALDIDTPLLRVEAESLEGTRLAGELNGVDVLVTTIVTSSGIALGVLVGHGRAKRIEHSPGGDILGGNQDHGFTLTLDLFFLGRVRIGIGGAVLPYHDLGDLRIGLNQRLLELLEGVSTIQPTKEG